RPDSIRAVGTLIFRDAQNADEYIQTVKNKTGIDFEIISGEKEAAYAFSGALYGIDLDKNSTMVVDIGGGSTEFCFPAHCGELILYSLPFGAVIITEKFLQSTPASEVEYTKAQNHVKNLLKTNVAFNNHHVKRIVFSGGTATSTAAAILKLSGYNSGAVHGSRFNLNQLLGFNEIIMKSNLENRREILKLDPQRADIIAGGLLILMTVMDYFKFESATVSDGGVRFGVLLEMFSE
ncbi:unnamed protein product, partial [marine sediment metagenome]